MGLGALELFARRTGPLSREDLVLVQAFAELATSILDDGLALSGGGLSPSLARAFDHHAEIAGAGHGHGRPRGHTSEAMVRLRAHAFGRGDRC